MRDSITQEDIKLQNRRRILAYLREKREATRQEIAGETGISVPTVAANIAELVEEGILSPAGRRESTGGRKPLALRFEPAARFALGIDLEPRGGRIVAVDLDWGICHSAKFSFAPQPDRLLEGIEREIRAFLAGNGIDHDAVDGIGFALPGTVDPERSLLEMAPNLGLAGIDFSPLTEALGIPVHLQNEANAAVWAEWHVAGRRECDTMIYLSVIEGLGGGLIINRRLFLGSGAMAGELGHMVTVPDGRPCNCGQRGCWERYVSERVLLEGEGGTLSGLKEFFDLISAGDAGTDGRWRAFLRDLAAGIRNLIVLFDPDEIVIGGEIALYPDYLIPALREAVSMGGSSIMDRGVTIREARLAGDAAILGAAVLAFRTRNI